MRPMPIQPSFIRGFRNRMMRARSNSAGSLGQGDAGSTHFLGDTVELRPAILDGQHGFLVVHVYAGLERQLRNARRVDVGKAHPGMLRKNVAAAGLAPLWGARWR